MGLPLTDKNTDPASSKISTRLRRKTFYDTGHTNFIVRPAPRGSGQNRAERKALAAIRPADNFRSPRTPRCAGEHAEIGSDRLLDIGDQPVVGSYTARQCDVV